MVTACILSYFAGIASVIAGAWALDQYFARRIYRPEKQK